MTKKKRLFAAFVSLCLIVSMLPTMAFAEAGAQDSGATIGTSGLCEHHTRHDESCGYTEGTAEIPCSHEHTEDCYTLVTECVHEHTAECYPAESVSENTATPSEPEEAEPTECTHVCSEESGCMTKTLDCKHTHNGTCGYVPATAGTPCTFVCEVCNAQDSGTPVTPSDAQPEECTCETLCTGEEINGDCPVCSAEDAELDKVCVGAAPMLPVTALADGVNAPAYLYVGDTMVSSDSDGGYWTTDEQGNLAEYSEGGDDWNVKYEPSSATLTLKNAKITGEYNQYLNQYTAGVYALCSSGQSVSLTIELIGENTIEGNYGIYVNAHQGTTIGEDASLIIKSESESGSLSVTGSSNLGINVKSGSGNASLTIENASVDAKTTSSSYVGVFVQSSSQASDSPALSLEVNGGSLTASGNDNYGGIQFYVGNTSAAGATTSLTVSENAIVDAKSGGISAEGANWANLNVNVSSGTDTNGGIVFDGNTGTVYGDVELQEDLVIGEGESLTIPEGSSLNANAKLTNNGTILVESGGNLEGEPGGNVVYAPTITTHPENVEVKENETATFTVEATGENLSYQWQQSTDNGSNWTDIGGATDATYTTEATTTSMNGYQYRCVVSNSAGSVTSGAVSLTVREHVHTWGNPVWSWTEDGKSATATFTCEKDETHKETPEAKVTSAVKTPATCTETGVTTYTATVEFDGQTYTDTKDVADIPATGHSYDNGKCTVCGAIASDFKAVITAGANGSWQKGTKDGLSFTSNAAYKHFQKVQVDGKDLDASNYTVKEGSTIVTLKTSYLETLSVGKHTLAIVSETGTATTEFTIKAAAVTDDTQSPQTGDSSNMMLLFILLLISGGTVITLSVGNIKRKNN